MVNEKKERFARIFPARVDKIRDQLRVLGNCASKSSYEYDQSKVNLFFAYILQEMIVLAKSFGVKVTAKVDNTDVELIN
jgi:hypothetical protein